MYIFEKRGTSKIVIKNSIFIAHAFPLSKGEEIKFHLNEIRTKYSDATHNVYAYIFEGAQKQSDDGEPKGTSGMPLLKLLISKNITNSLLIVTRYFGGIKLGTGGLMRAYVRAGNEVIKETGLKDYVVFRKKIFETNYRDFENLKKKIESEGGKILSTKFGEQIIIEASIKQL